MCTNFTLAKMSLDSDLFEPVIDALAENGFGVFDHVIPEPVLNELLSLALHQESSHWKPAGIGRGKHHHHNADVRSDSIRWLADTDAPLYWALMRQLRQSVNQALFMGVESFEAHCAHYASGGHYGKHLDAFRGRSNRRLSTVLYLNSDWQAPDGGQLRLYCPKEHETPLMDVEPVWGRWVVFLSESVPHEVLESKADRLSVAGWFRGAEMM